MLRGLLAVFGVVTLVFGAVGVLFGVAGVQDGGTATNSVDSELRYFAAWYAAAGFLSLRASRQSDPDGLIVKVVAGALLLGAGGRIVSLVDRGRPHWTFMALTGVEITAAAALLLLDRRRPR